MIGVTHSSKPNSLPLNTLYHQENHSILSDRRKYFTETPIIGFVL
jgi:hypothetical protein